MSSKQLMVVIGLVVLAVAGMAFYTKNVLEAKLKFYPDKLFESAFEEPYSRATDFQGVREEGNNYQAYLHFKYPHEAKPMHESEYNQSWVGEAHDWFSRKFPNHPGLTEINRLKFRKRTFNDATSVTNEWLIYNPRTDDHYYRVWGTGR